MCSIYVLEPHVARDAFAAPPVILVQGGGWIRAGQGTKGSMLMPDTTYLLERSRQEAVRSIQATHPAAAVVHQELCLLYVGQALARLVRSRL